MKKGIGIALCLWLLCALSAGFAQDRYQEVFDASADSGKLTARFLSLSTAAGKKSGDSTILTSPDGKVMLIDAGCDDCGDQVIAALQALGITRIDYLVESHPHADHIGGFLAVMKAFEVGQVITSYRVYPDSRVNAIMEEIDRQGLGYTQMAAGEAFAFGEDVMVDVLWPEKDVLPVYDFSENSVPYVNNHSLVLKFTYGESTLLFCGDLYIGAEWDIVQWYGDGLNCDVLKANHHGDRTSNSKPFRDAVSPQITVITADTMEDMRIYQQYQKAGSLIFHTRYHGAVKISTQGDGAYQTLTEMAWGTQTKQ